MSSKKNQDLGLDLVTPFVEIFEEFFKIFMELFGMFLKWLASFIGRKCFGVLSTAPIKMKDLKSKKRSTESDHLGYSINNKKHYLLSDLDMRRHTAVIGSTGSGKTVCLRILIEQALKKGKPVIYFDPKASLESVNAFKNMCERRGKKLYLFTDITGQAQSFNPLLDGGINDISDRIINALDWSEPFYKNECIDALDSVIETLFFSQNPMTLKNIVDELKKHKNQKNIKGLLNQLSKVSRSSFGDLLNNEDSSTLTFNKLRKENACLYIGISSMGQSSTGNILNKLFFGGLLTHAKDSLIGNVSGVKDPEKSPITVVFDELSSTIHEGFIDLQNKCRQAGIEIVYATQGPSDIDRISPQLTSQIFENTNNLFVFNQIVPEHTEFFARTFGTVTSDKKTYVTENDRKLNTGTVREVEEFSVHSNVLRSLKVGQCILFQRIPRRVDLLNLRHLRVDQKLPVAQKQEVSAAALFN